MATLDFSHILTLITGAAVASAGFVARRLITGAHAQERVAAFASLTDILAKLKQHGLSVEDVRAMGTFINSKQREKALVASALALPIMETEANKEPEDYWSQAAMNFRSAAALNTANTLLEEALLELGHFTDEDELREVQGAWENFRDRHANFAAARYSGGSIAPLIRASEAELLTQQRLAWVRAELEDRRRI